MERSFVKSGFAPSGAEMLVVLHGASVRSLEGMTHGQLLVQAMAGDESAWTELVDRFSQFVWSLARSYRLDEAAAGDVAQTVWLKLIESGDRINDPERLPGWLATTTKREAMRVVRLRAREPAIDFEFEEPSADASLEAMLIEDEAVREVLVAYEKLKDECRHLMRLLVADPPLSYEEISELAEMPIGSIGPTRGRCIEQLKKAMGSFAQPDNIGGEE